MTEEIARPIVGFIGFGDQGLPMAVAIADAGYELHAWARHPSSLIALGDTPYVGHDDLKALAAVSDVLAICVSTDNDVIGLLRGGLLDGLSPGAVLVNHGTGTPGNARRIAEMCESRGVTALDAPVSGGRPAAEQHTLTTLVGGPETALTRCRPIFETFSAHIVHLGDTGGGQTAKVFNNTLQMMNQASIYEIVELAVKLDVDPVQLIDALKLGSGSSRAMELLNTMITPETVHHLTELVKIDMQVFETAMQEAGIDADAVDARGMAGVNHLPALVARLNHSI